jgi:hypothetical protein
LGSPFRNLAGSLGAGWLGYKLFGLFGQDEFVVSGQAELVDLALMDNLDSSLASQQAIGWNRLAQVEYLVFHGALLG